MGRKVVKTCDYCGAYQGQNVSEGRTVEIEKRKCKHEICNKCWWYPGDTKFCPICERDKIDEGRKNDKFDWKIEDALHYQRYA